VRFTQRWKARDFFAGSPGQRHLSHTWEITVSGQAADDRVLQSRHYVTFRRTSLASENAVLSARSVRKRQ
jgi:hypothetical protein